LPRATFSDQVFVENYRNIVAPAMLKAYQQGSLEGTTMTPDTMTTTLQKGFRVTLGATATLIEAIQDPQTSGERFAALGSDVGRLTETLETKGEVTEREARQFVDGLLSQLPIPFNAGASGPSTVDTIATPVTAPSVQSDLVALTQELADIRQAIDTLKADKA
jgi:polyhydroxyalkanoate synthesis regulator phasin